MQAESVDLVYVSSYSSEYNHAMLVQFYLCLLFSDQAGLFSRGGYSSSVVFLGCNGLLIFWHTLFPETKDFYQFLKTESLSLSALP